MERPTRDEMLMEMASIVAYRSTCTRARVGAVIARDARVLSSGYNGTPAGLPHCSHTCDCGGFTYDPSPNPEKVPVLADHWVPTDRAGTHRVSCPMSHRCVSAVHAEANAIVWAARTGVATIGASLYTTTMPCLGCSQLVVNSGITRVVYRTPYRDTAGAELLGLAGIELEQLG